jgi:hypothetical protein
VASPYTFRKGPTFSGADRSEQIDQAFDMPLNPGATFSQGIVGGALESFGLGTVIRDFSIPQGARVEPEPNQPPRIGPDAAAGAIYGGIRDFFNPPSEEKPLTADEWKASPFYRENIPYDPSITPDRAAALAIWNDAREVREHFGSKSPVVSFFGNIAGQAFDPINYIPIAGPLVKAGAAAKFGVMGGSIAAGALDAAANTAIAGVLTAGNRASYGDDVSWQRQISDVATAALIGAAFGGVGGYFEGRRSSAAMVKAEAEAATLRTTQEARLALNGGIRDLALNDGVNLLPNEIEPVARRAAEYQQPLPLEDASAPRSVVTPTGFRVQVRPEVVDATQLTAASGELQPRDRTRDASSAQIEDIAINLDPERLLFSPEADRGAPIVGPDGIVESGNGRRMAIIRAAEAYPERFEAYKKALREQGFDVPDEGIPMLVSRRVSDLSAEQRVDFVNGANTSAIARMSATEAAMTDVRAMTDDVIEAYAGGDVKAAGNRDFVRSFLGNLPQNERASLVDANGSLNADGVRRVENSLVAAAYGDPQLVARFAEATDDNAKSITGAMSDVSADWARMRRGIAAGDIGQDLDLTPNVLSALRLISNAREQAALQGRPVSHLVDEAVRQIDMIDGPIDPRTEAMVQIFYGEGYRRAKSRDDIATALRSIVSEVESASRPQLFPDAGVNVIDLARAVADRSARGDLENVRTGNSGNRQGSRSSGSPDRQSAVRTAGATALELDTVAPDFHTVEVTDTASVQFDDAYQARHFELGRELLRLNEVDDLYDGMMGAFPDPKLGELEAQARRLFERLDPYLIRDGGGPRTVGHYARQAMQNAAAVMDEAQNREGPFQTLPIIEPDMQESWARQMRLEQNDQLRRSAAARAREAQPAAPPPRALDPSPPRQEAPPDGRSAAEATVGRAEDTKALAAQYGVDPKTGDFLEQTEIDQLMGQGRISEADEAELAAADETLDRANSYGEALKTAARCMVS